MYASTAENPILSKLNAESNIRMRKAQLMLPLWGFIIRVVRFPISVYHIRVYQALNFKLSSERLVEKVQDLNLRGCNFFYRGRSSFRPFHLPVLPLNDSFINLRNPFAAHPAEKAMAATERW
jgi:hypothetical protein